MGCLKLKYYERETAIGENCKIFELGIEKTASGSKICKDYYAGGSIMPGRNFSSNSYRYGAFGFEKDDEVKGSGNHYSFSDYGFDPRIIRRWRPDPKATLLPHVSPYAFALNNFINVIDPDGEFPILINGEVGQFGSFGSGNAKDRGNPNYWSQDILSTVESQTGYNLQTFKFVDGDQGGTASARKTAGTAQAKLDAQGVWNQMKENLNEAGQVTEQLQVITHSKGSAYGAGYMESLAAEVKALAKADGIGFAYDEGSIIEYSVNLAPHQSNSINYSNSGTKNVNISHIGDPLSGNDATGNVINVHSIPEKDAFDQHGNNTYNTELNFILNILENNTSKSNLQNEVKTGYQNYDNSRTNGDKSKVTQGGN